MTGTSSPLAGRTALITGAAKRIGRAMALAAAARGADVVVHYNTSATDASALADEIRQLGRQAWTIQCDLSDASATAALVSRALDAAGSIDILINNASIYPAGRITEITAADLAQNIQIHAFAPLTLSRAIAERADGGHIINLLDCRITGYDAAHAAYHLSKRMLLDLTRILALELAPGFAVNAIAPGLIVPPAGQGDRFPPHLAESNPLKRLGTLGAVADAALFLLESDFVTGQVLFIDGGRHLRGDPPPAGLGLARS